MRTKHNRLGPSLSVVEPQGRPGTLNDSLGDSAVKHVAAAVAAGVAATAAAAESAAEVDSTIRSPAVASCRSSSLVVWGTEALMSLAGDKRSCAAGSWWVSAVALAAALVDDRSPSEQHTDSPGAGEAAARPTAYPPYQPYRWYGPASSTCCLSLPAGRKDTATAAAAAASGEVPCAVRTALRRYPVAPCLAEQSDRIDSRRPFSK